MNYVFPNEMHVTWSVMIVLYPFITGLVAGAFIVSSLYHVFGRKELKAVARFSLASAFVFLLFAPLPLQIHLGRPERSLNILVTPNFSSAMAGFGYIYFAYLLLVILEIWFVMRSDFIARARGTGVAAWISRSCAGTSSSGVSSCPSPCADSPRICPASGRRRASRWPS